MKDPLTNCTILGPATDLYTDAMKSCHKPATLLQVSREAGCGVAGPGGTAMSNNTVVVDGEYPAGLHLSTP